MASKGLNTTDSKNRLRFETISERLQKINVDIVHKTDVSGSLNLLTSKAPETGNLGCYFQDELELLKTLEKSSEFKRFYYDIWSYVQSLPELLHHQHIIVTKLIEKINTIEPLNFDTFFKLISVLGRDLQDDLYPHFHTLFIALVSRVDDIVYSLNAKENNNGGLPNPELTGKLFECLSYLTKFMLLKLVDEPDSMRQYYGTLLGHSTYFVREYSAKCFTILLRKLKPTKFKNHSKKLFKALALNCKTVCLDNKEISKNIHLDDLFEVRQIENSDQQSAAPRIIKDILDGVGLLYFGTLKGIKNNMHSQGSKRYQILLELLTPLDKSFVDENINSTITSLSKLPDDLRVKLESCTELSAFYAYVTGEIVCTVTHSLFRHVEPKNMIDLWTNLLSSLDALLSNWTLFTLISDSPDNFNIQLDLSTKYIVECLIFAIYHSNGRGLGVEVRKALSKDIIQKCFDLCEICNNLGTRISGNLMERLRILFCKVWTNFSSHSKLNKTVESVLNNIVVSSHPNPAVLILSKELLKTLPYTNVKNQLIGPILKATAAVDSVDDIKWLSLVIQIIVKLRDNRELSGSSEDKDGSSFLLHFTKDLCKISERSLKMLQTFGDKNDNLDSDMRKIYIQSINILTWLTVNCPNALKSKSVEIDVTKVRKTILNIFKDTKDLLIVLKSWGVVLLAQCISFICADIECNNSSEANNLDFMKVLISNFVDIICEQPKSIALLWGFLGLLNSYEKVSKSYDFKEKGLLSLLSSKKCDQSLSTLAEILITPCYWLRISALRIFQFFPRVKLIQQRNGKKDDNNLNDEFIDLAQICMDVATTPLTLETEREFSRLLGMLEVFVREGKLSSLHEKIVCSLCFGMLNVKFKPVWEPCILVIVAACNRDDGESSTWPLLLESLVVLGQKSSEEKVEEKVINYESVDLLLNLDSGDDFIDNCSASSELFYYAYHDISLVNPDSRTDYETAYSLIWDIFKRCPSITLKRSKIVVPIFLRFLKYQYYNIFGDDPEVPYLHNIGLFSLVDDDERAYNNDIGILKPKILKKRLEMFLGVFSVVKSPKQLFMHQFLYAFYCSLLAKPDLIIVKLSFDCILSYKVEYVLPYKDNVKNLLEDKKLRNELITFTLSIKESVIDKSHRADVIPLISSIVFGRFVSKGRGSKAAREQSLSRRVAVLSFISNLQSDELRHFMHLMMRGIVPRESLMNKDVKQDVKQNYIELSSSLYNQYELVNITIKNISSDDISKIASERQIGFLHVLEHVIKVIGFNAKNHIEQFIKLVKLFLTNAESMKKQLNSENEMEIDNDEEDVDEFDDNENHENDIENNALMKNNNLIIKIRTMCINRLAEMVHQYNNLEKFSDFYENVFDPIPNLLIALPTSLLGTKKPSALLKLIHALVKYNTTSHIVINNESVLVTIIKSVASRTENSVTSIIMEILTEIMNVDGGKAIFQHTELIIQSFSRRFVGFDFDGHIFGLKFSELKISVSWSVKQELKLLSNIAEAVFVRNDIKVDSMVIADLATLLLGMLRKYTTSKKVKIEEEWVLNILRIYKSLLGKMIDVKPHVTFVSRLFGPASHSLSLFNTITVRQLLVEVYAEMARHASTNNLLDLGSKAITKLLIVDPQMLDSRDFSECMPVFQSLIGGTGKNDFTWSKLVGPDNSKMQRETSMCTVIIFECIRCMYDSELVLRTAALSSLKRLVLEAGQWSGIIDDSTTNFVIKKSFDLSWMNFLSGILLPEIRHGLKVSTDTVKKGFVSLLAYVVANLGRTEVGSDPMYHGDLFTLLHEDPEQDFFENIVHVQLHRRVKALAKLRIKLLNASNINYNSIDKMSNDDDNNDSKQVNDCIFSIASLVHVLLPLGYHPLTSSEFAKKDHLSFLQEAASFIGSICLHLPWNHYFFAIKTILKQIDRKQIEKEKVLLTALCSVLDSFHFDMSGDYEVEDIDYPNVFDEQRNIDKVIEVDEDNEDTLHPEIGEEEIKSSSNKNENIVRIVINSILPWVRVFLLKEEKDHAGNKSNTVRTQVAVALTKLINRLQPPSVTYDKKRSLFVTLVISVVNTLKSRDTSARDAARESLQKMVATMGLESLQCVVHELLFNLTEGYQRHVCNYTIRNLITSVTNDYSPPLDAESIPVTADDIESKVKKIEIVKPLFDSCIPLLVKCVLDEICGQTHEDRTVDEANRTVIREAKGSKAHDIVEATARSLLFRPTYALQALENPSSVSSIHALTTPLLSLLTGCENNEIIGRISEALQRIAIGLSKNPTVNSQELLLYLHATLNPFVSLIIKEDDNRKRALGRILTRRTDDDDANDNDEDIGSELPSYLREDSSDEETQALYSKKKKRRGDNVTGFKASTWLPAENQLKEQRAVIEERNREIQDRVKVQDGASAPKLTGISRHKENVSRSSSGKGDMDPAHIAAVRFCLYILNSALNKNKLDSTQTEVRTMAMPFLQLLGQCLRMHGSANIVALAMRCICSLLTWNLPIDPHFSKAIGSRMLKLMFKGGVLLSTDNELVQACIKGLVSMFTMYNDAVSDVKALKASMKADKILNGDQTNSVAIKKVEPPLNENKLRYLVQLLTVSVMEVTSTYQNAAFQLVNAIVNTKILIPEIYDLVAKLIEQIVLSHRKGIREAASEVVLNFLLTYPLGEKRLANHLKQLIVNCNYEFEDGRKSALDTLLNLTKAMPIALLEENTQMIFMPMAMKLVNDNSGICREAAANVIISICRRISNEFVSSLVGYATQWLGADLSSMTADDKKRAIVRTGSQVAGIICSARPDVFKRNQTVSKAIGLATTALYHMIESADFVNNRIKRRGADMAKFQEGEGEGGGLEAWAVIYYILIFLEQVYTHLPSAADNAFTHSWPIVLNKSNSSTTLELPLMGLILETLLFPHSWVRSVASRVLKLYLSRRDVVPGRLSTSPDGNEILTMPNGLYNLGRKLCVVLNQPELPASLLEATAFNIVFIIRAMEYNPALSNHNDNNSEDDDDYDDNDDGNDIINNNNQDDDNGDSIDNDLDPDDDNDDSVDDNDEDNNNDDFETSPPIKSKSSNEMSTGSNWIIQRLRGLGSDIRGKRRLHVLKIFSLLVSIESEEYIQKYILSIIEVAIRAQMIMNGPDMDLIQKCKEASTELMNQIENKIGSSLYLGAYAEVQKRLETNKSLKRARKQSEAVTDPKSFALRKLQNTLRKKNSKKKNKLKYLAVKGYKRQKGPQEQW